MGEPSFLNLYYLRESAFREHNFNDFSNDGSGGDPIEKVSESEIAGYIRRSCETQPVSGRLEGFSPDFDGIFHLTLSPPGSDAFIRTHPNLPITARDYLLSKAYQFLYLLIIARYPPAETAGVGPPDYHIRYELHSILSGVPDSALGKLAESEMNWWWAAYSDTLEYGREEMLQRLKARFRRVFRVPQRSRQGSEPPVERETTDAEARVRGNASVTPRTAMAYLNVSARHIGRLVKYGKLDPVGQGRNRKITTESLCRYKPLPPTATG